MVLNWKLSFDKKKYPKTIYFTTYEKNHHTSAPPIHTFFELHQHNVPQKIKFFMKIYYYENKNTIQSEKLQKSQFYCFHPCHVGVLCSKILIAFWHI